MDWHESLHRFDLDEDTPIDKEVNAIPNVDSGALVYD
jgi:hypothetical protein